MTGITILDCTLRDGGYYTHWDFDADVIVDYLASMKAAQVDVVELGFRFLKNDGFKGACAYTRDDFLLGLPIPQELTVAVMVNGSDLCTDLGYEAALERLFPNVASESPVSLVRLACHYHEFERVLPAVGWLSQRGYRVGFNLMQITDRTYEELLNYAQKVKEWPVEVLYFADSTGSMTPDDTARIIGWLREVWDGPLGVHTHDNMGLALANTLRASAEGATWLDATVTGMGRGPGNARTEELVIEAESRRGRRIDLVPLMTLVRKCFGPMKMHYGWGTNPYYYLSGKYGIHPTYIQEMLGDTRFGEEDLLAVIDHLRADGGKKFSVNTLEGARQFYRDNPQGSWQPATVMAGREVLILGTGPGAAAHRPALEAYIRRARPLVMALNTQSSIEPALIDLRIACHPVRLLADAKTHATLPQPLITPASQLPEALRTELGDKELLDFGIGIEPERFAFNDTHCVAPTSLVIAYALAVATSGQSTRILMAGFDGYPAGDSRNNEVEAMLNAFSASNAVGLPISITQTTYNNLPTLSLYGL